MMIDFDKAIEEAAPEEPEQAPPPETCSVSLASAKSRFLVRISTIKDMVRMADAVEVVDKTTFEEGHTMKAQAAKMFKEIERVRVELTDTPRKYVDSVNGLVREPKRALEHIKRSLGVKMERWHEEQEQARRLKEKKAQEAARKLQEKLDKQAEDEGTAPVIVAPAVIEKAPARVSTEEGSTFGVDIWDYEIVDISKVPREYLRVELNKALVRAKIGADVRSIPGLRIFPRTRLQTKTN